MSQIKLSETFIKNTVKLALNEDLYPSGDITSNLVKNTKIVKAKLISNEGIVIIETPNTDCIQFKLFKNNAIHLDSPRHRVLYNKKNLSKFK